MSRDQSIANSTVSDDTSSDLLLDDKDVMCPVCKDVFVFPRTYECGHTVCELCMYEMDRRDCSVDAHTARIHHCPVCRHPTLKSWHKRPLSILIEKIASAHPSYSKRKQEVLAEREIREGSVICIPKNIDLAAVSNTSRIKIALSLYDVLIERLYKASLRGLSYLVIRDKKIVREIETVIDIISTQLFAKNNIYKIMVTRGECTIHIHKDAFTWRRSYENRNWGDPAGVIDDRDGESTGDEREDRQQFSHVLSALMRSNSTIPPSPPLPPRALPPVNFSRQR